MLKGNRHCWRLFALGMALFACLSYSTDGTAQSATWYFGWNAGIQFIDGEVIPLSDGALYTDEGCATRCNSEGALLFYTDGQTVWNRSHVVMPNGTGLTGSPTSTQSAIIVPKPGSNTIYYIFTAAAEINIVGLRYSEVDMDLNNGLGNVTQIKNVPIIGPVCEKVAAVKHANGVDYWVVTRLAGDNTYHSYLITPSGVSMTPVVSNVGQGSGLGFGGYLTVAANGTRMVNCNYSLGVELFDFDNATGVLSDPILLGGFERPAYGAEFSPDCSVLYVSVPNNQAPENSTLPSLIYQFDLLAGTPQEVVDSRLLVGSWLGTSGALRRGPDGRIYCAENLTFSLGIINQPNVVGEGCDFVQGGLSLNGRRCRWGLPEFTASSSVPSDPTGVQFSVPNVFTPNGDGNNDLLVPLVGRGVREIQSTIYNRWGSVIYRGIGMTMWTGRTFSGESVPAGTYFYEIEWSDQTGPRKRLHGFVTLIR